MLKFFCHMIYIQRRELDVGDCIKNILKIGLHLDACEPICVRLVVTDISELNILTAV